MGIRADSKRVLHPLFQVGGGGSSPTSALSAKHLVFEPCIKSHACDIVREWHSRLPRCQAGPWTHAFRGYIGDLTYVVALWNNTSARELPRDWRELRRMACSPDAPKNTPSRFLSWMAKWFRNNEPEITRLISYHDTGVHTGTIYRAAGWLQDGTTVERIRDRTTARKNTGRMYRWNTNGEQADATSKVRWSIILRP